MWPLPQAALTARGATLLTPHVLSRLGFDQFFEQQLLAWDRGLIPGRVVGQHRRQWDVVTQEGTVRAVLAGRNWAREHVVQLDDAQPAVGDWVAVQPASSTADSVIAHILQRKSELSRTSVARRGARQTLVANVDLVGVVAAFAADDATESVAKRSLHPRRIERYLAAIIAGGARPLVLVNKADLFSDAAAQAEKLEARLSGVPVLAVSTVNEEGLVPFTSRLAPGETIALVGLSGVGKSSIINCLLGRQAQKVSAERSHDGRGRHTTTHRELFLSEAGFCLIDTPGMREFALSEATGGDLEGFADIVELAQSCQFRDCTHHAEPGCGVRRTIALGQLDADRLESYQELVEELSKVKEQPTRRKLVNHDKRRPKTRMKKVWDED
jgi:ribosome biogenesis GTPase / thiamine phosphate phosphatase